MSNTLKLSGAIRVGKLSADPANPEDGLIYFNTTAGEFRQYSGGTFDKVIDQTVIDALVTADGSVTTHNDVTSAGSGIIISSGERSKLSGIESAADVTDATNVAASGAVMESDATTASMSFVIDEDNMISNLATKVPTQQSVKQYVDNAVTSATSYKGGYDAATDSPSLDSAPNTAISIGDQYTVTVAGTFYTIAVEVGDVLIAEVVDPTVEADWTIVNKNLDSASIKAQYESNANTNEFSDAEQTLLGNQSGTNTGDEVAASTTVAGISEIATPTEVNTGLDGTRTISPLALAGSQLQTDVTANNAKVSYSAATAKADVVNDSITDGNVDTSPSENAVFDALALKADSGSVGISNVVEDATPQLGGNLDVNGNDIEDASNDLILAGNNSIKRAKQASKASFIEEEYIHSIALSASQTNTVIADLNFAHASIEGLEITYKLKEATSGDIRIGTIRVVTNGSSVVLNDISTETADTGVSFDAVINAGNINIRYSSGANGATLRADIKKFLA